MIIVQWDEVTSEGTEFRSTRKAASYILKGLRRGEESALVSMSLGDAAGLYIVYLEGASVIVGPIAHRGDELYPHENIVQQLTARDAILERGGKRLQAAFSSLGVRTRLRGEDEALYS